MLELLGYLLLVSIVAVLFFRLLLFPICSKATAWHEVGHGLASASAINYFGTDGKVALKLFRSGGGRSKIIWANEYIEAANDIQIARFFLRMAIILKAGYIFEQNYINKSSTLAQLLILSFIQFMSSLQDRLICFFYISFLCLKLRTFMFYTLRPNDAINLFYTDNYYQASKLASKLASQRSFIIEVHSLLFQSINTSSIDRYIDQALNNIPPSDSLK